MFCHVRGGTGGVGRSTLNGGDRTNPSTHKLKALRTTKTCRQVFVILIVGPLRLTGPMTCASGVMRSGRAAAGLALNA